MPISCHSALPQIRTDTALTLALAGNPNVGKSSIFNQLTGMGVITANYPGKTVEVNMSTATFDGLQIGIVDLPGTYALGAVSEDQWVARQAVLEGKPDAVVVILDATNLARNLYMLLQFLDLGFPIIAALNIVDQAKRQGIETDARKLAEALGVPVVQTVAINGKGLDELVRVAVGVARSPGCCEIRSPGYGQDIERAIELLSKEIESKITDRPYNLSARAIAILLLENDPDFVGLIESQPNGQDTLAAASKLAAEIERDHGEAAPMRIARERHGLAGTITAQAETIKRKPSSYLVDRLWQYTTAPWTGMPILLLALASIFGFLFFAGSYLSTVFGDLWAALLSPIIDGAIYFVFGQSVISKILIWGPDAGIQASLSVGIPYVLTFYFILALLEDTGYLNSVAFLTDRIMHNLGLHGRAAIPLVAGAGCNVPAIIGTRVLTTMRERVIASFLIVLVPCSARTAVILGAVYLYAGWQPAMAIYLIVFALIFAVGIGLNKLMPGQPTGLVMEMFPFRTPNLATIIKKTWYRFKDFVFVATPIVLGGSLVLGALYETGYIWYLTGPLSPVVEGWLGLPAVAGLTLIFAVLRKELALQLLVALALVRYGHDAQNLLLFMDARQLFVYALVNTIYIPCVATIAVLGKELGWKRAALIVAATVTLAGVIGGVANWVMGSL
ncbi:MAG: ferrous iron transport protein B [Chloroflexi bacterium]|nr:ferrous iron transport protein B [Chloroflexota bacterium]MDA8188152.1 ferrous iron transport protein B [Dehalococcoidales bacterium]